tara:strand:- start:270 stop:374 length:105 start_codon:yes stop_codon:yes gene_type:complete
MDDNQISTNQENLGIRGVHIGISLGYEWITGSIY